MMQHLIALETLLLSDRSSSHPLALRGTEVFSFGDFRTAVRRLVPEIQKQAGRDWLIAHEDTWDLVVALFAVLHAGGRPVLPASYGADHLHEISENVDGTIGVNTPGTLSLLEVELTEGAELSGFDISTAEIVLHTSGSSGKPEAFYKPLRCLKAEVQTLHAMFAGTTSHTVIATVPAHHIYGLLFRVLWPLAAGWPFDLDMIKYPEEVSHRIDAFDNCQLVSSPAFLKRSVDVMDWPAVQPLGNVYSSGGPLPVQVSAVFNQNLTSPVHEVYGSTETGGIGSRVVYDADAPSRWTPLKSVSLAADAEGRLIVRSPHILEEEFQTADLVEIYEDGTFLLKGRADRIVKIEEVRVSLSEIETRLKALDEIGEVRAIALFSDGRAVVGVAAVPSDMGWSLLREEGKRAFTSRLKAKIEGHIPRIGLPRKWRFVQCMPDNAQGKVTVRALESLFEPSSGPERNPKIVREEVDGNEARLSFDVRSDMVWFEGHFDEASILPGMVQIGWASAAVQRLFGDLGVFVRLETIKFFEVFRPEGILNLDLTLEREKSRVIFRFWSDHAEHSKGRIVFGSPK